MSVLLQRSPPTSIKVRVAQTWLARMRGLLGYPQPAPGEGILIPHCWSIHTIGMRYPIDVVFLDQSMVVVRICPGVPPGRLALWSRRATHVLELASGQASALGICAGKTFEAWFGVSDRCAS